MLTFLVFNIQWVSSFRNPVRFPHVGLHCQSNDIIPEVRSHFYSQKSFSDLGLIPQLHAVVTHLQLSKPSKVQSLSFPHISSGKSCILADQTGSGKTLAYLLPLLQELLTSKNKTSPWVSPQSEVLQSPQVLIIAPTSELAM